MGRNPWTTKKQYQWLASRRVAFRAAQQNKTLQEFHQRTVAEFFETFELRTGVLDTTKRDSKGLDTQAPEMEDVCYAPNAQAARDVSPDKVNKSRCLPCTQRIIQWYHNHGQEIESAPSSPVKLDLRASPTQLPAWRKYQRAHYDQKLKATIDEAYKRELQQYKWKIAHGVTADGQKKPARIAVHNRLGKELFDGLDESVKQDFKEKLIAESTSLTSEDKKKL